MRLSGVVASVETMGDVGMPASPIVVGGEGSVAEVFAARGVDAEHDEEEEGEAPQ